MRPFFKTLIYSLVLLLVFFSCGDDDSDGNPTPPKGTPPESDLFSISAPGNNAVDQSLLVNPVILFSQKIDSVITNKSTKFKLAFDEASLSGAAHDVELSLQWTRDKDSLVLAHEDLLKPLTSYTISIKTHWEEEQQDGTWKPYPVDGQTEFVTQQSSFATEDGDLSKLLPGNIHAAYPIPYQLNFLKSEYAKGYVKLAHNRQNHLFETSSGATQFDLVARFTTPGQNAIDVPLEFDESSLTASHDIPGELTNETIYKLQYLKISKGSATEQELYAAHFRTSKFNTFAEKMSDYTLTPTYYWETRNGVIELYRRADGQTEFFDDAETHVDSVGQEGIMGYYHYSIGLIQFELLPGSEWYEEKLYPLLYDGIESSGLLERADMIWDRRPSLKMPPVNGLLIRRLYAGSDEPFVPFPRLTESDIQNNLADAGASPAKFIYNVGPIAGFQFLLLRGLAAAPTAPQNAYVERLKAATRFPSFMPGDYSVNMKYVLPGMAEPSSEVVLPFTLQ